VNGQRRLFNFWDHPIHHRPFPFTKELNREQEEKLERRNPASYRGPNSSTNVGDMMKISL